MSSRKGFTLVELMIVVAIIAIIAAIAIPNLLRARVSANESAASGAMRTICTGEIGYQAAMLTDVAGDGIGDFGTLVQLATATPPFIDGTLGAADPSVKQGYTFTVVPNPATFTATATPVTAGSSGNKGFFVDESGVIRMEPDNAATAVTVASNPM